MARNFLTDMEAVLGGAASMAAEYAAPWLGMARAGITGGSEADAMDWARETLGPVANIDISPEAREVQAEIASTLGTGARALYENTPISTIAESGYGRGVAQKAGEAWSNLSDDTKAKLEMSLAALDVNPGGLMAGFVPSMIKQGARGRRLYHGSRVDQADPGFAFDNELAGDGAHWFTPNREHAGNFGDVQQYEVTPENPKRITEDDLYKTMDKYIDETGDDTVLPRDFVEDHVKMAKDEGYDGLEIEKFGDLDYQEDVVLPFNPESVKRAPREGPYLEKTDKPNTYRMGDRDDITPLNVDLRNPLIVDLDQGDKKPKQWELDLAEAFDEKRIDDLELKREGHDGVIIKRPGGDHDYKLISPGQINSRATDQLLQDALDFTGEGLGPRDKWKWVDPEGVKGEGGNPNVPKGRFDDPNWHPISPSRMNMAYDDMTSKSHPDPDVLVNELKHIQAEDMRDEWQMTSPWDRTTGGTIITEVNDKPLANPVTTEGGQRFINIDNEGVLASGEGVVKGYEKKARSVPEGDKVNIAPSAMSHTSSDFSTMGAEVHVNRLPEYPVSDEAKAVFDKEMWEGTGKKADKLAPQPKWPGLDDPDLAEKLKAPGMGGVRIRFLELMDKAHHKKAGFPDTPSTRKAIQDTTLEDVPIGWSGGTIGQWDLEKALSESGHTSYPVKGPGQARGTLGKDLPLSVMQADHIARRRLVGQDAKGDMRSVEMSKPIQQISPELAQIMDVHPGLRRPGGPQ